MTAVRQKRVLTVLIILTLVFIWGNSVLSMEVSGAISDTLMEAMNRAASRLGFRDDLFTTMHDEDGDGTEEPTSLMLRKVAHVTEFAVLGALVWLRLDSRGKKRAAAAVGLGVAAGALDEALQFFAHRGNQITDVLIDSLGTLLGVALAVLISRLRRRRTGS